MRLIAMVFGPHAPDTQTSKPSIFSFYFNLAIPHSLLWNWLRVFGHAEASRMGQGVGQQRHTRAVRSEKWWDSVAA
jgi:hypothetical protein